MSDIKFVPVPGDGKKSERLTELIWLRVRTGSSDEILAGDTESEIYGWVRPEVAALVKAAPELLAALQMLVECKDVKGRLDHWEAGSTQEMAAMAEWYDEHKPKAWAAARAAIARATS